MGVMEAQRRAPSRWTRRRPLRCFFGRHDLEKRMIFIEGSHWRTTFEYCRRCPYIHDAHAKSHKR